MVGRSATTNLLVFELNVIVAFSKHKRLIVIRDFFKAFDKVSHGHLLMKMKAIVFDGVFLKRVSSYLSKRKLQVRYNYATS